MKMLPSSWLRRLPFLAMIASAAVFVGGVGILIHAGPRSSFAQLGGSRSRSAPARHVPTAILELTELDATAATDPVRFTDSELATEVGVLRSRIVLSAATASKDVAGLAILKSQPDPPAWLGRQLHVEREGRLIEISWQGEATPDAARLVNAVAETYLATRVEARAQTKMQRLRTLKELYEQLGEQHAQRRRQLADRQLSERDGVESTSKIDDELHRVRRVSRELQVDLAALRTTLQRHEQAKAKPGAAALEAERDAVAAAEARLAELEKQDSSLRTERGRAEQREWRVEEARADIERSARTVEKIGVEVQRVGLSTQSLDRAMLWLQKAE